MKLYKLQSSLVGESKRFLKKRSDKHERSRTRMKKMKRMKLEK